MWPEDWAKQMEKMNESVGEKNRLDKSWGNKWLVCRFWKCIGCIILEVAYGIKGNQLLRTTENMSIRKGKKN